MDFYYLPFYYPMCKEVAAQIKGDENLKKAITDNNFDDLAISWNGMFLKQAKDLLKRVDWTQYEERFNSILYSGLEAQTLQLSVSLTACFTGHYATSLRELRNAIESSMLFFRFDFENDYRKKSGKAKLSKINQLSENEKFGRRVFEKSNYSKALDVYKDVYKPLCAFTHTDISVKENQDIYEDYCFDGVSYQKERIQMCLYYIQKVVLIEIDMMKEILIKVYGSYQEGCFDGIFDKELFTNPEANNVSSFKTKN